MSEFYSNFTFSIRGNESIVLNNKKKVQIKTIDINLVSIIMNRCNTVSRNDLMKNKITIIREFLNQIDENKAEVITADEILSLLDIAYAHYAKIKEFRNDCLGRGQISSFSGDIERSENQIRNVELVDIDQALQYVKKTIKSVKTSKPEPDEIERFSNVYDELTKVEIKMKNLSDVLKMKIVNNEKMHVKNLVIGGGDAATEYWLSLCKENHNQMSEFLKKKPEGPLNILFLAMHTGNWKHDYTLAQTYSLLERADVPSNPRDFTTEKFYQQNRHVNARFLYQSNLVNLSKTEAPIVLDAQVLSVESKERHSVDWEVNKANCRVTFQFKLKETPYKTPIKLEHAAASLFQNLTGNQPKGEEALIFLTNLLSIVNQKPDLEKNQLNHLFSSNDILALLRKSVKYFESIKEKLGLPDRLSYKQFSDHLRVFLDDVIKYSFDQEKIIISSQGKNEIYDSLRLAYDEYGLPKIIEGKLMLMKEKMVKKQVYTDQINVCSGFGEARKLTNEQFDPTLNHLGKFNPILGYTPVVDGNSFMLTNREEKPIKRDVVIYGGGGNATACYRKAFFLEDSHSEDKKFSKENQIPTNITWFSRGGFEFAGYGELAKAAITFANENQRLCCGNLIKVEESIDGKIKLFFEDSEGTYENKPIIHNQQFEEEHPLIKIQDFKNPSKEISVREFECDQLIYTIGQDSSFIQDTFKEFKADYEIFKDDSTQMPLGTKTKNNSIHFWGAAAMTASPSAQVDVEKRRSDIDHLREEYVKAKEQALKLRTNAKTKEESVQALFQLKRADLIECRIREAEIRSDLTQQKQNQGLADWTNEFNDSLRDWIVLQKIARDAEWPGVMPPSRAASRRAASITKKGLNQQEFSSADVNLDDFESINGFLVHAGVNDTIKRVGFLKALLDARSDAYNNNKFAGINSKELDNLIEKFELNNQVVRDGQCILSIKRKLDDTKV